MHYMQHVHLPSNPQKPAMDRSISWCHVSVNCLVCAARGLSV